MKKLVGVLLVLVVSVCITPDSYGFGLGGLKKVTGGGSGGTDWAAMSKQSDSALADLYAGQSQLSDAVADLADVVGLKEQAAELRGHVANLQKCGSSSCSSFSEIQKSDDSVTKATLEKLKSVDNLTAEQKKKASAAMKKYIKGGILYAKGLKDVKILSKKAMDAPAMQKIKFAGLIKAAPVAGKGAGNILQTAPTLFKLATAKDIEYPEDAKSEMMSSLTM
ncbi:hypothetical protein C2E25_17160 [Geothermobacter hydrogeniphilus]|uniref:Uncharacterized protein n=1 Tax=Geothermobacter hydrogeniphilus TaxID=1969733 RepID=A0A2K2H5L3_9BACT|nr:hypothetical protein [Geothermobacter hydrogeniphilus]PNU18537.1 hypothetical protein C2E25_17160 [Geothermobacter hydrogeniphilus]